MEIVQFKNDNYAIRIKKDIIFLGMTIRSAKYLDLKQVKYRWSENSEHFRDCCIKSKEMINRIFDKYEGLSHSQIVSKFKRDQSPTVIRK